MADTLDKRDYGKEHIQKIEYTGKENKGAKMGRKVFSRIIVIALAIVLVALMMLTGFPAAADEGGNPVTIDVAKQVAVNQLNKLSLHKTTGSSLDSSSVSEVFTVTKNGKDVYYIINLNPEGWVIVSADYVAYPIIGCSDTGSYSPEKQNPAFDAWMENVKEEIYYAIANRLTPFKKTTDAWQSLKPPTKEFLTHESIATGNLALASSVSPLLTTIWGQGGLTQPFIWILAWYVSEDLYCPVEINWAGFYQVAPTGCVATAMGQIMKYWNWPVSGEGSHTSDPSYAACCTNTYGPYTVNFAARTYDWAIMPNGVAPKISGWETAGDRAVAQLLRDCGTALDMDYQPGGSSASTQYAATVLPTYFRYDNSANYQSRGSMSSSQWGDKVKAELNASRPVQYRGSSGPTGHSFVCDGYNASNQFHFNWGWDGSQNGYYTLDDLTPGSYNFNNDQGGIFDLKPDYPPVAANNSYSVNEDQPLSVAAPGVLGNDSDTWGDPLIAVKDTNPSNGTLALNANGSFTYWPKANFNGTDSFTYHARDGKYNSATVKVTITVGSVNDAPVAVNDSYSVSEDQTLNVAAPGVLGNDSDVEGNPITAVKDTDPGSGTLTINANGSFSYKPNANFSGTDSFKYHAWDGTAGSNVATVTITVNGVNDPPAANNQSVTAEGNTAKAITLTATDVDGDALTYTIVTSPSHGGLSGTPPNVIYTPAPNYSGNDSFTFRVYDGKAESELATVSITVNPDIRANLRPKEYRWSQVNTPAYSWSSSKKFNSWNEVRFENKGPGNAFNVTATITSAPANVIIADGFVAFGNIPVGSSDWSSDGFALVVDMDNPQDPKLGIVWRVEYYDSAGIHHVEENIPQ